MVITRLGQKMTVDGGDDNASRQLGQKKAAEGGDGGGDDNAAGESLGVMVLLMMVGVGYIKERRFLKRIFEVVINKTSMPSLPIKCSVPIMSHGCL